MVQQVIMQERIVVDDMGNTRVRTQLAHGTHPQLEDEDTSDGVVSAIARDNQKIRVILDELLLGNYIEEIACDGFDSMGRQIFSRIPPEATPDDMSACSPPELTGCKGPNAICVVDGTPIGVLDTEQDGAPDAFRMIRYEDGELAIRMFCDGGDGTLGNADDVSIPLDQNASFYNPSGNQLLPAGPCGFDCLGPALVVIPEDGMRTGSLCGISFQNEVIDKDLNQVCAPAGGDITRDCTEGDVSEVAWGVEPLRITNKFPPEGGNAPVSTTLLLVFNASMDPNLLDNITATAGGADHAINWSLSADDPKTVEGTPAADFPADAEIVISVGTDVTDRFGGALPAADSLTFTTDP